jgi:tryptophan-rich sensory protein
MKKENIIKYGIPVLSVVLVALLGSVFVDMGMDWFDGLQKPTEWIPNIVIPIMWSFIYSVSIFYLIHLVRKEKDNKRVIWLLIINGFLNVLWCFVFFTLNSLLGGLIVIIINLIASVLLLKEICKTSELFSYILTVYPLWLSVATCLNLASWILN